LAPAKVLLVDDDDSVLSGLGIVLEAYEFDVTTASTVTEALQHIAQSSFDVLLTDLHMPGPGDGLVVAGAMRHACPDAVTLVLSANPDMAKATAAILRQVDEVLVKPVHAASIVDTIRQLLANEAPRSQEQQVEEDEALQVQSVEFAARVIEQERKAITEMWLSKMREAGSLAETPLSATELTEAELSGHLPEAVSEVIYRLQYPQPLGLMTLFSMSSLQHGARRRRQGFPSPVLVEEARALQVALFQVIEDNIDLLDARKIPCTLMAIADEVNAQLLQSLSGYENEKPVEFAWD
jgi:DNA-binding response OmpR family regulator